MIRRLLLGLLLVGAALPQPQHLLRLSGSFEALAQSQLGEEVDESIRSSGASNISRSDHDGDHTHNRISPTAREGRGECCFIATRYGDGRLRPNGTREPNFNGQSLGCSSRGTYSSTNPSILAAPQHRQQQWHCGTQLVVTNPANGVQLHVVRVDACPGCGANHVDLSESGIAILCGGPCDQVTGLIIEEID